jgi:hypothetical protein
MRLGGRVNAHRAQLRRWRGDNEADLCLFVRSYFMVRYSMEQLPFSDEREVAPQCDLSEYELRSAWIDTVSAHMSDEEFAAGMRRYFGFTWESGYIVPTIEYNRAVPQSQTFVEGE